MTLQQALHRKIGVVTVVVKIVHSDVVFEALEIVVHIVIVVRVHAGAVVCVVVGRIDIERR